MTPLPRLTSRRDLTPDVASDILEIAGRARLVDGVSALSEAFTLALDNASDVTHTLAHLDGALVGYAARDPSGAVELVVDPAERRRGTGTALVRSQLAETAAGGATAHFWAHGDLPGARAVAAIVGLVVVRELHHMTRNATATDATDAALPAGFRARPFVVGADEQRWLAINAAAFVDHPEQGRIDLDDLRARMDQPWFDPTGFILVEDETVTTPDGDHPLAAFHWTKREPDSRTGEVYVVGVHPAYQGRGLARPVTVLGTSHLARQGVELIELYVDGDNVRALATYRGQGFTTAALHVVYASVGHEA